MNLPSLLYHPYFVCILFGMPSLHPFTFLMVFFKSCTYYTVAVKLPLLLSIDINECELETDNCHVYANCTDAMGSFDCTCNSGYEGDGVNCTSMYELKMAFCSAYIPTLCTCCGMSLKILYWCWNVIKCNLIGL